MKHEDAEIKLGIAGTGAIGATVATAVDGGRVPGMVLTAIAASSRKRFDDLQSKLAKSTHFTGFDGLAESCDWIVEALPPDMFEALARPVLSMGKTFVVMSCSQLLNRHDIIELAERNGARIVVPSGAMLGLDGLKATAIGTLKSVTIETRKPVAALINAPFVKDADINLHGLAEARRIFSGSVTEAARVFPANVNVAAALALAGLGPDRTLMEVWADPSLTRNQHKVRVMSDSADLTMTIQGRPTARNPATGIITAQSVIALLRDQMATMRLGT